MLAIQHHTRTVMSAAAIATAALRAGTLATPASAQTVRETYEVQPFVAPATGAVVCRRRPL